MKSPARVQNLNEAVWASLRTNVFEKCINPSVYLSVMGKNRFSKLSSRITYKRHCQDIKSFDEISAVEFNLEFSSYLPNPSAWAGYNTRSIFKRSLTGLNSEFSFSLTSCLTKAEEPSLPYYFPIAGGE